MKCEGCVLFVCVCVVVVVVVCFFYGAYAYTGRYIYFMCCSTTVARQT